MRITEVKENKKRYLDLLLLGDEQEDMIDRYLDRGAMYLLEDGGPVAQCVVTDEGNGVLEIKNIAVAPSARARAMAGPSSGSWRRPTPGAMRCSRWAPATAP